MILKDGVKDKEEEVVEGLKEIVKKKIAAFAVPNAFLVRLRTCTEVINKIFMVLASTRGDT